MLGQPGVIYNQQTTFQPVEVTYQTSETTTTVTEPVYGQTGYTMPAPMPGYGAPGQGNFGQSGQGNFGQSSQGVGVGFGAGGNLSGRTLLIRPVSAQLTHNTEFIKKMDPQVEVTIGTGRYRSSVANHMGKTPQWQDSFTHIISGTERDMAVVVWDMDKATKPDLIGETRVPLQDVFAKGASSNWYDLFFNGKPAGRLLVNLEIIA